MAKEKSGGAVIEVEWYRLCDPGVCVRLKEGEVGKEAKAEGKDPADAIFNAIDKILSMGNKFQGPIKRDLKVGAVKDVGKGEGPKSTAMISVNLNGFKAVGKGIDVDILRACASAYVSAINQVMI